MGATGRVRVAVAVVLGSLFRVLLLLGILAIALVDVTFLLPQSRGSGIALNVVLLACCALLAWYTLRPVVAPGRTYFGRRVRPVQYAGAGTKASKGRPADRQLADTTWL